MYSCWFNIDTITKDVHYYSTISLRGRCIVLRNGRIGGLADWRIGGLADWRIGGPKIVQTDTIASERFRDFSRGISAAEVATRLTSLKVTWTTLRQKSNSPASMRKQLPVERINERFRFSRRKVAP